MNDRSALYKALSERGQEMQLSPDFQLRMMCQIRKFEARKKRRERVWSIVGYTTAIITAVTTLIVFCGNMFSRFFETSAANMVAEYQSVDMVGVGKDITATITHLSGWNISFLLILGVCAWLLLSFDSYIRKKYSLEKSSYKKN